MIDYNKGHDNVSAEGKGREAPTKPSEVKGQEDEVIRQRDLTKLCNLFSQASETRVSQEEQIEKGSKELTAAK